ncbi:hypothetical protein DFJ74DRAFT_473228 [Hyaloraphidium curvatum]|nr:hypothetical protein DFJ74DRAFT_473228 [Hyaloraphidium curvatum]
MRSFIASFLPQWFRYVPATCRKDLHGRTVPFPSAAARTTFSRRCRAELSPETPWSSRRPGFAHSPPWLWRERDVGGPTPGWCVSTPFTDRGPQISAVGRAKSRCFSSSLTSSVWLLALCQLSDLVCHLLVARCPLRPARTGDSPASSTIILDTVRPPGPRKPVHDFAHPTSSPSACPLPISGSKNR